MKILTVRQPWAWAIIHGGKDVENRTRNIAGLYRGPVAIHAGLAYDAAWSSRALDDAMQASGARLGEPPMPWWGGEGHIIGVVNLWAVHRDADGGNCCARRPVGGPGGSPWAERDVWHLCLNAPRPLSKPLPYRGALGLRDLPGDLAAELLGLVGGAR
jgi:hypothetical protein